MLLVRNGRSRAGIDRLQTHFLHQSRYSLVIDGVAMPLIEPNRHLAIAIEGCSRVFLIDHAHQSQIQRRFTRWLPVIARPVQTHQFALTPYANAQVLWLGHLTLLSDRLG